MVCTSLPGQRIATVARTAPSLTTCPRFETLYSFLDHKALGAEVLQRVGHGRADRRLPGGVGVQSSAAGHWEDPLAARSRARGRRRTGTRRGSPLTSACFAMMAFSSSVFSTTQRWSACLTPSHRSLPVAGVEMRVADLHDLGIFGIGPNAIEDLRVAVDAVCLASAIQRRQGTIHPFVHIVVVITGEEGQQAVVAVRAGRRGYPRIQRHCRRSST